MAAVVEKEPVASLDLLQANQTEFLGGGAQNPMVAQLAALVDLEPEVALQVILRLRTNGGHIVLPGVYNNNNNNNQNQPGQQQSGEAGGCGAVLSSTLSYLNHSCEPNAAAEVRGGCLRITALWPVAKGEELTISYIDAAAHVLVRRATLRDHYQFDCSCARCKRELSLL